jgi:hypothetical protein
LTRPPQGCYAEWINSANQLKTRDACPLLALDCASGLNADTGMTLGDAICASHTITFISAKPGLLSADGPDHSGEIRVAKLELKPEINQQPDGKLLTLTDFSAHLKARLKNSHKGSFGSVGILGGAPSMTGAAFLAGPRGAQARRRPGLPRPG